MVIKILLMGKLRKNSGNYTTANRIKLVCVIYHIIKVF